MLCILHLPLLTPPTPHQWVTSSLPASPQHRDPHIPKVTPRWSLPPAIPLLCRQWGISTPLSPPNALLPPRRAPRAEKQPRKPMSNWGAVLLLGGGEPHQPSQAPQSTRREGCS